MGREGTYGSILDAKFEKRKRIRSLIFPWLASLFSGEIVVFRW
jgi:hypothetical protein